MAQVHCPLCDEDHDVREVEFVDIEETIEGWDKMTYICPVTKEETSAVVRGR